MYDPNNPNNPNKGDHNKCRQMQAKRQRLRSSRTCLNLHNITKVSLDWCYSIRKVSGWCSNADQVHSIAEHTVSRNPHADLAAKRFGALATTELLNRQNDVKKLKKKT